MAPKGDGQARAAGMQLGRYLGGYILAKGVQGNLANRSRRSRIQTRNFVPNVTTRDVIGPNAENKAQKRIQSTKGTVTTYCSMGYLRESVPSGLLLLRSPPALGISISSRSIQFQVAVRAPATPLERCFIRRGLRNEG